VLAAKFRPLTIVNGLNLAASTSCVLELVELVRWNFRPIFDQLDQLDPFLNNFSPT